MQLTKKIAGGCDNGPCPAVYETDDPAVLAVQGARLASDAELALAGPIPAHETLVLVPRAMLTGLSDG